MSIQQSINQLIGTSTVAAGLYGHLPSTQRKREAKRLESAASAHLSAAAQGAKSTLDTGADHEQAIQELTASHQELAGARENMQAYQKLYESDPEKFESAKRTDKVYEKLQLQLEDLIDRRQGLLEARKMILEGTPADPSRELIARGRHSATLNKPIKPREVIKYGE